MQDHPLPRGTRVVVIAAGIDKGRIATVRGRTRETWRAAADERRRWTPKPAWKPGPDSYLYWLERDDGIPLTYYDAFITPLPEAEATAS